MKVLLVIVAVAGVCLAKTKEYNFNKQDYCGLSESSNLKALSEDERALVIFREPGSGIGAIFSTAFSAIKDRCTMKFSTGLLNFRKKKLQVRFDVAKRFINDKDAYIRFYDADSVVDKKLIREVSKSKPVGVNSTFTTKSNFLTIQVYRDFDKAIKYNVEMTIEPVNSASAAKWSMVTAMIAVVVGRMF